jgi:hypothetical protein
MLGLRCRRRNRRRFRRGGGERLVFFGAHLRFAIADIPQHERHGAREEDQQHDDFFRQPHVRNLPCRPRGAR